MKTFGKKVVLIGDGSVGSSYAFAMVTQGLSHQLVKDCGLYHGLNLEHLLLLCLLQCQ
jgi:malate/lactate dehydrogenase